MKTQTAHLNSTAAGTASANNPAHQFAGFGDWFEVFRTGTQTDSEGNSRSWTEADLDSIVANHSSEAAAPLVVGHPKTNDPAYGWTDALKREGDLLLAKATGVADEFAAAVEARHYPKRSVSLVGDGNGGYQLRHIGFLGAVAPAISGLKDITFNGDEASTVYEFAMPDALRETAWGMGSIARALRGLREWIIAKDGIDTADEVLPGYQVDSVQRAETDIQNQLKDEPERSAFSTTNQQDDDMDPQQLQTDLTAANSRATVAETQLAQFQQQQRLSDASTLVGQLVSEGKLLPAHTPGIAEFVASLPNETETAFEFSSGEATTKTTAKKTPHQFMTDLLSSLGKQIQLGADDRAEPDNTPNAQNFNAPAGYTVDQSRAELDRKASEYAAANNCDYLTAVTQVEAAHG